MVNHMYPAACRAGLRIRLPAELEPSQKPKVLYTDNSQEFGKSCEELSSNHRTSTPFRSDTNGIAERAFRRVQVGTSAVLLQSGLGDKWWSDSLECYCYLRNVQDFLADGKMPYERRSRQSFKGPIILSDALVEQLPNSERQTWNSPSRKESITRNLFKDML